MARGQVVSNIHEERSNKKFSGTFFFGCISKTGRPFLASTSVFQAKLTGNKLSF